jgi:sugar/nucleoside kinase (ribokinase family)
LKYVVAGEIRNEFIIDRTGKALNNTLGGSLLYAGAALNYWGGPTGLLGLINENISSEKIQLLEQHQLDIRGIKKTSDPLQSIAFYAYPNETACVCENPVAMYAAYHLPLPRELIEFEPQVRTEISKTSDSCIFPEDIPLDYLDASAAHICPFEIVDQMQISSLLQRGPIHTMTIQLHPSSMVPAKLEDIAILTKDSSAIITDERGLHALFSTVTDDLIEMMERICSYGSQYVIVKNSLSGYSLFNSDSGKGYRIPDYPSRRIDPTGELEVFSATFLTTLHDTYDPLQALAMAVSAASIKVEGSGPFSIENSLPGLDKARMSTLRDQITQY